jgi:hypothetical protein
VALTKLARLYADMDAAYQAAAQAVGLSCQGCTENCCTSFFQHHTHVEWLSLRQGMAELPEGRRSAYLDRARAYLEEAQACLARGETPRLMCPLNDDGLCGLHSHRLMICRLHGVPNVLIAPGGIREFPGCGPCQRLTASRPDAPVMDRTPLLRRLAALEMDLWGSRRDRPPKVDLTLAAMLVHGDIAP